MGIDRDFEQRVQVGGGPAVIIQVHHSFTGETEIWCTLDVTHCKLYVEADEVVVVIQV